MSSSPLVQRNPYKGSPSRAWVRLGFLASDGSAHQRDLLADTGSPCAVILGATDLALLRRAVATGTSSNFGFLSGGWLELSQPELGLTGPVLGFGSDRVLQAVQAANSDFAGLVGLPLLRMAEYGGDNAAFFIRARTASA